jgi:hypothetical protein
MTGRPTGPVTRTAWSVPPVPPPVDDDDDDDDDD